MPILVDIASLFEMLVWCCRNVVLVKLIKVFFFFMAALRNRVGYYIFALWLLSSFFSFPSFSSPNLSGRGLDVYHTSTHGVAVV